MYINSNYNQTSFKSKILTRILVNGFPSVDEKNVQMAMRATSDAIFHSKGDKETVDLTRQAFMHYDKDFRFPSENEDIGEVFRKKFVDGISYIFTGKQAGELDKTARKIGPIKSRSLQEHKTTRTYEALEAAHNYFDQMDTYNEPNMLLKSSNGDTLVLTIATKTGSNPKKLILDWTDFDTLKVLIEKKLIGDKYQQFL